MTKQYTFEQKVWLYPGKSSWHFITLPDDVAKDIDFFFSMEKQGWGSLPVQATIGETAWKTSIFSDKKSGSYLLPLKVEVRKKENISENDRITVNLEIKSVMSPA